MAGENNQQQTPPQDPAAGNSSEARTAQGELKDQNPTLTQPSGTEGKTSTEGSQNDDGKSFLNRKPAEPTKPEAKAGDDKPADPKPDDVKSEAPQGAPEKYTDFKLPDGYAFDPEALKTVSGLFKEAGLSQENAQKLVDYYAENSLQATKAPYDMWANLQKDWVGEIDNRFGSKADGMRNDINQAIDSALPPKLRGAFREALDFTGAGSNPDFFEALSILAKPFLEGTSVPQGRVSPAGQKAPAADSRPTLAEAIYPHLAANRGQQ